MSKPTLQEILRNKKENSKTEMNYENIQKLSNKNKLKRPPIRIVKPIKYVLRDTEKYNDRVFEAISELVIEIKKLNEKTDEISSKTDSMQNSQDRLLKEIKSNIDKYHSNLQSELEEIEDLEKKIYHKKEEILTLEKETLEKEKNLDRKGVDNK